MFALVVVIGVTCLVLAICLVVASGSQRRLQHHDW
jgi:hypothetical protein